MKMNINFGGFGFRFYGRNVGAAVGNSVQTVFTL
jgi:hypothetical protein